MRRRAKVDINQPAIVESFRVRGAQVLHLHQVGDGCPDLLVGYRGALGLVEVKRPGEGLNPDQQQFFSQWGTAYPVYVVRSDEDVSDVLRDWRT